MTISLTSSSPPGALIPCPQGRPCLESPPCGGVRGSSLGRHSHSLCMCCSETEQEDSGFWWPREPVVCACGSHRLSLSFPCSTADGHVFCSYSITVLFGQLCRHPVWVLTDAQDLSLGYQIGLSNWWLPNALLINTYVKCGGKYTKVGGEDPPSFLSL